MSLHKSFPIWRGFQTSSKLKSQKYRVKRHEGKWAILCAIDGDEYFCVPDSGTDTEKALNGAVEVGIAAGIVPGGTLYINEYKDVIKTAWFHHRRVTERYFVGNYPDFQIMIYASGSRIDNSDATGLKIGDPWPFPEVGTRYEYRPSKRDILMIHAKSDVSFTLSFNDKFRDAFNFDNVLDQLAQAKGNAGGSFFVNEHGLMFAPRKEDSYGNMWNMVYAGKIDFTRWVPHNELKRDWDKDLGGSN